jgi:glutathione S-transferase
MKLYYTPSSPYAACVRAVIAELKAEHLFDMVISAPFDNGVEFLAANPLGKVPCLVDDGMTILDSEVICDYIDANISGGLLFEDVYANWHLKTFYSICSGLIDVSVNRQIEKLRDKEGLKSEFWWQRYQTAIQRTLRELETRLESLPERFNIIHISLFCAMSYLDFRHADFKWRSDYPKLVDFYDEQSKRPCFERSKLS